MILKLAMDHCGLKIYKEYINDDPWLTVTDFMARSNLVKSEHLKDHWSTGSLYDLTAPGNLV